MGCELLFLCVGGPAVRSWWMVWMARAFALPFLLRQSVSGWNEVSGLFKAAPKTYRASGTTHGDGRIGDQRSSKDSSKYHSQLGWRHGKDQSNPPKDIFDGGAAKSRGGGC